MNALLCVCWTQHTQDPEEAAAFLRPVRFHCARAFAACTASCQQTINPSAPVSMTYASGSAKKIKNSVSQGRLTSYQIYSIYCGPALGLGRTPGLTSSSKFWFLRVIANFTLAPGLRADTSDSSCVTSCTGLPPMLTMTSPGRMPALGRRRAVPLLGGHPLAGHPTPVPRHGRSEHLAHARAGRLDRIGG